MQIHSLQELTQFEKTRMIKCDSIWKAVVQGNAIVDPETFETYLWFGREAFKFEEVKDLVWPWIHWDHPFCAAYKAWHEVKNI
jgi:hypothetical protein